MFHLKSCAAWPRSWESHSRRQDLVQADSRELQEREGHMSEQAEASSSGCSSGSSSRGAGRLSEDPQLVSLWGQCTAVMRLVPKPPAMMQAGLTPEEAPLGLSPATHNAADGACLLYSPGML